jgi:hypothetical protein
MKAERCALRNRGLGFRCPVRPGHTAGRFSVAGALLLAFCGPGDIRANPAPDRPPPVPAVRAGETIRTLPDWTGPLGYRGFDTTAIQEAAKHSPELRARLEALDREAIALLATPPATYRRAHAFQDIPAQNLDARAASAGKNRDVFALAMSDCAQTRFLFEKGVRLALATRLTDREEYLRKCLDLLEAAADYHPLQRPGWNAYSPTQTLPPDGDGVWLATGWGLSGIVDMLTFLGDRVPEPLAGKLRALLRAEVGRIVEDWEARRPWYVRSRAAASNQWIEPTLGLINACLFLDDPDLLPAYNLGVRNLAESLAANGEDGAFLEGMGYARMTLGGVFETLDALKQIGDMRCHAFPFVNRCWFWMVQMHLPGPHLVNGYDSGSSRLPAWATFEPLPCLAAAARAGNDPAALPIVRALFPKAGGTLSGLRYAAAVSRIAEDPHAKPVGHAHFPSQHLVVWRSRFERPSDPQTALALWVRGGSARDGHAHRDQGQVSVYRGTRVIWMDCGTPNYADPALDTHYASAAGHNIFQPGELSPRGRAVDAPLTVLRLDNSGGEVQIDTARAYRSVEYCTRDVLWSRDGRVEVRDRVRLTAPAPGGTEFYRFHTGSDTPLDITGAGNSWTVRWTGAVMTLVSDRPIRVLEELWPDRVREPFTHRVARILPFEDGDSLTLTTTLVVE